MLKKKTKHASALYSFHCLKLSEIVNMYIYRAHAEIIVLITLIPIKITKLCNLHIKLDLTKMHSNWGTPMGFD